MRLYIAVNTYSTSGPSSVLFLLTTDNIPDSSSSGGEERPPPPMPTLLQPALPTYLDTINEEESDDLRSVSSSSFASPRTVIDRSVSTERFDNTNRSISSRVSDSDYQSPEALSPQQGLDVRFNNY
uniref:Uncharacterized protein n=1 Tax=Heterorhabditis bacteriophora TaxID=37862 RepID=A0A1I7WG53_HETBA